MADTIRYATYYALLMFCLLLSVRVFTGLARLFLRSWTRPTGWAAAGLEAAYLVTDPPLRLLRKVIPTQLRGVGMDLSVKVLFAAVLIVMQIVKP